MMSQVTGGSGGALAVRGGPPREIKDLARTSRTKGQTLLLPNNDL